MHADALLDWADQVRYAATGLAWTARNQDELDAEAEAETLAIVENALARIEHAFRELAITSTSVGRFDQPGRPTAMPIEHLHKARRACAGAQRAIRARR
jgi:hypothetical protein